VWIPAKKENKGSVVRSLVRPFVRSSVRCFPGGRGRGRTIMNRSSSRVAGALGRRLLGPWQTGHVFISGGDGVGTYIDCICD